MSNLVLFMSMSLDGFIAGPDDSVDNPFGTRGHRLHAWLGAGDSSGGQGHTSFRPAAGPGRVVFDEMMTTGATCCSTGRPPRRNA